MVLTLRYLKKKKDRFLEFATKMKLHETQIFHSSFTNGTNPSRLGESLSTVEEALLRSMRQLQTVVRGIWLSRYKSFKTRNVTSLLILPTTPHTRGRIKHDNVPILQTSCWYIKLQSVSSCVSLQV